MKSLWRDQDANQYQNDPLAMRVYSSRLLGQCPELVLHGGGNTSVKLEEQDIFGDKHQVLYVKGSGWDLIDIEKAGFAPVKMEALLKMAKMEKLSDKQMVQSQKAAMLNPSAPNPSVEAILHAIIPTRFVDHTHCDAVVTITNTPNGQKYIEEIFPKRVLFVPYVMPGFELSKKVYEISQNISWEDYDAMILMNHGVFSFADDAKRSYEIMIEIATKAEDFLKSHKAFDIDNTDTTPIKPEALSHKELLELCTLRKKISELCSKPMLAMYNDSTSAMHFSKHPKLKSISTQGPLTPDHVIRTKRTALVLDSQTPEGSLEAYAKSYEEYFQNHTNGSLKCLDPAPRWVIWPNRGFVHIGENVKSANICKDIAEHSAQAILRAEALESWRALPAQDIFDVEYWELEQAKLGKSANAAMFQGKVVLVTGAASGIGKASCLEFLKQGAAVIALDINPKLPEILDHKNAFSVVCDLSQAEDLKKALHKGITQFGGIDILVSNAGVFPASQSIEDLEQETWQSSLNINLTSHQQLLSLCIPFLKKGLDANVVFIGSKNVPAPGPGAAAYSAAKAALNQLARVAALELAPENIRVNIVHPNAVFDTNIWSEDVLEKRAKHYKMSVSEYKSHNLLSKEVRSCDVANLVCALASPLFSCTTGAQLPIDGGNERVI